jgi:hypothetical protein
VFLHTGDFSQIRAARIGVSQRIAQLETHVGSLASGMKEIMKKMETLVQERAPSRSPSRTPQKRDTGSPR